MITTYTSAVSEPGFPMLMEMVEVPSAPIIATPEDIHERYLMRAVDQWLDNLDARWDRTDELLSRNHRAVGFDGKTLGNVRGQQKWFKLLTESLGDLLLASALKAQSRARLRISYDELMVEEFDGARQLLVARQQIYKAGVKHRMEIWSEAILLFTRHSLMRLIQRGGVVTVDGLRDAIREAWGALAMTEFATREIRNKYPNRTWAVPTRIGDRIVVFICSGSEDRDGALVVKTVMLPEMLNDYLGPAANELLDFIERHDPLEEWDQSEMLRLLARAQTHGG